MSNLTANPSHLLLRQVRKLQWLVVALWVLWFAGVLRGWWKANPAWLPLLMLSAVVLSSLKAWASMRRERQIREGALPQFLKRKWRAEFPHLSAKDAELVERGLRQFFLACKRSPRQFVAMPSKAVDVMWHEFILHTRAYEEWCDLTLGRFLHHTPAEALGRLPQRNDGLRRAWYWACKEESIDPRHPTRLPLLFALDTKLGIEGGFSYVPDCRDIGSKSDRNGDGGSGGSYCGTSFSDGSSSGDSNGFGGSDSSGGSGDGGSDGDGGGGDGGGGCGGGD
jgi:hypothetical protein